MKTALVLSAETPSACAVVRALHARDFEVAVVAEHGFSPAALSWRCHRSHTLKSWTAPLIEALIEQEKPSVVVPATEADLLRFAPARERIEKIARVVAPPASALELALDKAGGMETVRDAGVAIPEQWVLSSEGVAVPLPADLFPAVAKPALSRVLREDGSIWSGTAGYVADPAALDRVRAEHAAAGIATVVQRIVPGVAMGCALLLGPDGEPALVFVHRRVRELRPEGGPSACATSEEPREDLVAAATCAARVLGLVGAPVQFEFRVPEEGPPVLLDVNPRPWGTLGLALDAGVDFYGAAADAALGGALPSPPPPYRAGLVRHYLPFELRRAFTVLFGTPQDGYPGPWPRKDQALFDWLFLPDAGLVGKLDDPMPAVGDLLRLAWKAIRGPNA